MALTRSLRWLNHAWDVAMYPVVFFTWGSRWEPRWTFSSRALTRDGQSRRSWDARSTCPRIEL